MEKIILTTGCLPPCSYTEYSLPYTPIGNKADGTMFRLSFSKRSLVLRKEVFVYPVTSLVAEFGGTFGLFVGFSFIMFYEWAESFIRIIKANIK